MTTTNESREAMEPVAEVAPSKDGSGVMSVNWSDAADVGRLMFGDKLYSAAQMATVEAERDQARLEYDGIKQCLSIVEARVREIEAELEAWRFTNRIDQLERDFEDRGKRIASLESALAAAKSGGEWQLVPKEPTLEMMEAGNLPWEDDADLDQCYRAMLNAAPSPLPAAPKKEEG